MSQSLKDLKSKNLSTLKVDGNTRTIAGTFAASSGDITGLPSGHGILIHDRIELSYTVTPPQIETGIVNIGDGSGYGEPNLGVLRVDKAQSQYATLGAAQAALTVGTVISFQDDVLTGGTVQIKASSLFGGATVVDGVGAGDPGYWIIAIDLSTATGFPSIGPVVLPNTYPISFSPPIPTYQGVAGLVNLTDLIVSALPTSTSVSISIGLPNIASFTDVLVTKHSRIKDAAVFDTIEADVISISDEPIVSDQISFPYSGSINSLTALWGGLDDSGNKISRDRADIGEISPTDPFNIGVDMSLIQMLIHPEDNTVGVLLYQDLTDSLFYLKGFKYTYDGGFVNTFTPYLISGADSNDIRMEFSTKRNVDLKNQQGSTLIFIFGGKATPGPSIYMGVVSIDTSTLAITDSGHYAWADTTLTLQPISPSPTPPDFVSLIKIVDLKVIEGASPEDRRLALIFTSNIAYLTYNTTGNTPTLQWNVATAYDDYKTEYYGYRGGEVVLSVSETVVSYIDSSGESNISTIPFNSGSQFTNLFSYGNGDLRLYKIDQFHGIGSETYIFNSLSSYNVDQLRRSNSTFVGFPTNFQNAVTKNENVLFDLGDDKVILYKSFGYYVIFEKSTGNPLYMNWISGGTSLTKSNLLSGLINGHTVLFYTGGQWVANKILTKGPFIAYKKVGNNAIASFNHSKVVTPFNLEKTKSYYLSYAENSFGVRPKIDTTPGFFATKIGTALDTNLFLVETQFKASPFYEKSQLIINTTKITGGATGQLLKLNNDETIGQPTSLTLDETTGKIGVGVSPQGTTLLLNGNIGYSAISATVSTNGTINNLPTSGSPLLHFTGSNVVITGIANPGIGFSSWSEIILFNDSPNVITLKYNDTGSSSPNRISTPNQRDYTILKGQYCRLVWQSGFGYSAWNVIEPISTSTRVVDFTFESDEIDFTTTGVTNLTALTNDYFFYVESVFVLATNISGVLTAQPFLSIGTDISSTLYLNNTQTTALDTSFKREVMNFSNSSIAEEYLSDPRFFTVNVVTAATGTGLTFRGKLFIKGVLYKK